MAKTFEAMEHAERERANTEGRALVPREHEAPSAVSEYLPSIPLPDRVTPTPKLRITEIMAGLHQNIAAELPEEGGKVIQFAGTTDGEDSSVLVREFARFSASWLRKSVLLLDANRTRPYHLRYFGLETDHGWEECVFQGEVVMDSIHRVGDGSLYAGQVSARADGGPAQISDLPKIGEFFEELRSRFDLVLVDSPASSMRTEGLALSRKADGAVLIVEAEKTRRHVARKARDMIESHGGRILGVILNQRRYPIPSWCYKWL